jgi:hypothetical protein
LLQRNRLVDARDARVGGCAIEKWLVRRMKGSWRICGHSTRGAAADKGCLSGAASGGEFPTFAGSASVRGIGGAVLLVLVFAALAACTDESASLSIEEGLKCASEAFKGHPGAFSQRGNAITYSYKSPSGPANVIVTFDERRRPLSTFFESAPHGSHPELMDAARAIKDCVAYGPMPRGKSDKNGATSMIGR